MTKMYAELANFLREFFTFAELVSEAMKFTEDEKTLIIRLRKGDYDAYRTLYRLFYLRFLKFATSMLGDETEAKDIVQESFLKVWINREKLNEEQSIFNFLYVLVKHEVISALRLRRMPESLDTPAARDIVSNSNAEAALHSQDIEAHISSMPDQRRTVFTMSRFRGMSNKEIAESLGISEKTVERHITLALSDLRKYLS